MFLEKMLTVAFISGILGAGMRLAMPILYAALGEVFTERSGILNIGIEGMMLMGAFCGFLGSFLSNSPWVGMLFAMVGAGLLSLLHAYLSISLGADQVISGLSINLLALGLVTFLNRAIFGLRMIPLTATPFQQITLPVLGEIPVLGSFLFSHHTLVYIGLAVVPIIYIILFKTTFGLRVSAVGEDPRGAEAVGINVVRLRYVCVLIGGMLAGVGGVTLSLANLNLFKESMVSGRGYIAIAIVMFGHWNPISVLGASLIFGLVDAFQLHIQSLGFTALPSQLLISMPYIVTILFLVIRVGSSPPSALSVPYVKEG
jgi:general nucleoside transport system permease protein